MVQDSPRYCSILAQEQGFDPIGTATPHDEAILIELPLPWAYRIWDSPLLPVDFTEYVLAENKAREYRTRVLFIAPEAEYCRPGMLRIIHFRRPTALAARFERVEYSVPTAEMPDLVRAIYHKQQESAYWQGFRQEVAAEMVDLMVCTHGAVDVVCAKFGYPAYKVLRSQYTSETVRVWRVSHFGGHICAPTLLTYPDGRAWAFINAEQAPPLVLHRGEPRQLYGNYRGWGLLPRPFGQVVEREVWMREGWAWLACEAEAEILDVDQLDEGDEDAKPAWAEVLLRYRRPNGRCGSYRARVELNRTLDLYGSTKSEESHAFAQYQVVMLERQDEMLQESVALSQIEGTLA